MLEEVETRKKEDKVPEPDSPAGKSESTEKTEISMADFPTQFGKPKKKNESYFHEGMSDLPSHYDDEDDERGYRRRRREWTEGNASDEERFEREYDEMDRHRFGRGRGRGGRFGRPPRHFDNEDEDEFGRDGPPRFEDNPFRRLEKGDRRPPYEMDDRRPPPPRDRFDDRPPFDDERFGPPGPPRFRRGSPPPFDDDRRRRFRRDGPPFDGPPPFDRPPFDDDRFDRPPRFGPRPPRFDHDGPPRFDRDGLPPPPPFDDDRPPYDRYHFHRDGPPKFGPPRSESPPFGPRHHGPPPPRPRGGLLPTPPPSAQQQPEQQYSGPPPGPPEGHHQGPPFPAPDGGPRFGPPQQTGPPPPMGPPPPFQPPQPFSQGPPSFPAPPQPMMQGPPPGVPPQMPPEMPPMSTSMENQQYFPPPPPPMMQPVDPMMQQQMYGQMPPGQMPPGPIAGLPPPPPPQFNMQHQQPPPPPPMEQPMIPQVPPPPMEQHQQVMPQFPPQPPMTMPQQSYEPMPPPQVMAFPPPPPPPPADSPTVLPVPEQIPIPPPPAEEEPKSEDMEIESSAEVPEAPAEQPMAEEAYKTVYSAPPSFSQPSEVLTQAVVTSLESQPQTTEPAFVSTQSSSPFLQVPPTVAQQNDVAQPQPPPPPTVVFPTQIYSAPPQIHVQEEAKTAAQKAAQELLQLTNHMAQTVQAEQPAPQPEPEPEPVETEPKGFQPVETEIVQEPILNPEPVSEIKQYPVETQEKEQAPEKQSSGDPIKTTAQQLLERIKQKQLKAQASSAQGAGTNPLVKSTRRFFNPVAMVAGSKIQFAMATAKKNVTTDNPLKAQEEDAEKKKKKEGKKEMFRPGLDGEETLSSIMQKYQQHQKIIENLKTSKDGESDTPEMSVDPVQTSDNAEYTKVTEEKDIVEKPKEEVQQDTLENKMEVKKRSSRFADMTEEDMEFVREKEQEALVTVSEESKPKESSPERKKEDDKPQKSRRSPSPEYQEESKSKHRRRSPSPRERQRSRSPDRSRERRDRRSRSRSYEDRYSYDDRYNRKSRRSPSPRRRDYDDRRRGPFQRYRDDDFQRGYRDGRGYRGWRPDRSPSPRSDYRSRQRERSASPRSKNYRSQRDRSSSPKTSYRSRPKERSPSPKREYSESPDEYRSNTRRKSPESEYMEKKRETPSKDREYRASKQRDISPPQRSSEKPSRGRERTPEYPSKSSKQVDRSPSPQRNDYRSSKQRSPSPRQADYRNLKQRERSPSFKSNDYKSRQGQGPPAPEESRIKPRERSSSPRLSEYNQKRRQRSPSPKLPQRETSPRGKVPVEKQRTDSNVEARRGGQGQGKRKDSASSSSSSSESSSSEESDSDQSSDTPEDERIKKEKREKLLMELKSIEESLEKQRTLKKKGKGKDFGKMEDRERSEDRQSQKSGRSEEEKKSDRRWDSRQKRDEERPQQPSEQKIKEAPEKDFDDRQKQDIPDFYLKSVEKYQKEYKSKRNEYEDQSRKTKREDYEQPYGPEERWERDRRESRMEYDKPVYDDNMEQERRSAGKRSSGDERTRGEYDDRRYLEQLSDPQPSYGETKREKVDSRKRFDKRKQEQKYEKSESSEEEMEQENARDRRRDSRTRYPDRSPRGDSIDPRYSYDDGKDNQRYEYEDKRKPVRTDSRRGFSERNSDYDGSYTEKRRESYSDYTDMSDRSYNDRRQDQRSQEKSRARDEYDETERKREYESPPLEESPRKRERVEYPSKQSEYESYEGYHTGSRDKSNKIDPVDELDYYLNRKPKPAQPTQPEKNGKWHTEKSVSPPDIRQSYYSPNRMDSDEEEQYEKKSKKKKKHRSRSPISRDSKKKSKKSKRSPSEDSEDQNRYRRSYRSPVMEELERDSRRRSPSPRYRRSPSPEDQPYHSRAERYWRPPDHKLDEIHHYTDKKHKSASIVQDFPQLVEIEEAVRKAGDKENQEGKDEIVTGHERELGDKATQPDPTKKQEPDDPPLSMKAKDTESSSIGGASASHHQDENKVEVPKQSRRRPKIKRLPVPEPTSPSASLHAPEMQPKSGQSDPQSETTREDEKSVVSELDKDTTKAVEDSNPSEICRTVDKDKSGLASLMSVYEDSDNESASPQKKQQHSEKENLVENKSDVPPMNSSVANTSKIDSEVIENPDIESSLDVLTTNTNVQSGDIPKSVGKEQRRSIIADYSDSDDNTNQSTAEQVTPERCETNTSQNLADEVFRNIMSKMIASNEKSPASKEVELTTVQEVTEEVVPSSDEQKVSSKLESKAFETCTETDTKDTKAVVQSDTQTVTKSDTKIVTETDARTVTKTDTQIVTQTDTQTITKTDTKTGTKASTKPEPSNDAIKLQYKRTRYGIRVKAKEQEKTDEVKDNSSNAGTKSNEVKQSDIVGQIVSITTSQKTDENKPVNQLQVEMVNLQTSESTCILDKNEQMVLSRSETNLISENLEKSPGNGKMSPVTSMQSLESKNRSPDRLRSPKMFKKHNSPERSSSLPKTGEQHPSERRSRSPMIVESRSSPERHNRSPKTVKSTKSYRDSPKRYSLSPDKSKHYSSPKRHSRSPEKHSRSPERHSRSPETRSKKSDVKSYERHSRTPHSPRRQSWSSEIDSSKTNTRQRHTPERPSRSPDTSTSKKSTRSHYSPKRHSRSPEMVRSKKVNRSGYSSDRYSRSPEMVRSKKSVDRQSPERHSSSPEMVKSRKLVKSRHSHERDSRSPDMIRRKKSDERGHSRERYSRSPDRHRDVARYHVTPERLSKSPADKHYRYKSPSSSPKRNVEMTRKESKSAKRYSQSPEPEMSPRRSQMSLDKEHVESKSERLTKSHEELESEIKQYEDRRENVKDQASDSTVLTHELKEDTDVKSIERRGRGQSKRSTAVDETKLGSARWSLRSRGSEDSQHSDDRSLESGQESPKPTSRSKRSLKSDDDDVKETQREELTARRRTRSSRSTEDLVDQKTPDIPIERQLSKRQKKSRKTKKGDEKMEYDTKALEKDPKLSSPISVDLSSIALPGEGIRIKIFSESLSPTSVSSDKSVSIREQQTITPCNVRLEEIVLPGEISKKTTIKENLTTEVSKKEDKETKEDVMKEKQSPPDPPRKEYPIRSQKIDTNPTSQMLRPKITSKKLPDDRRQPIKFGLTKSSATSKRWNDDEEDMDFTDKLVTKKPTEDELECTEAQKEVVTMVTDEPKQPSKDEEITPKKKVTKDEEITPKKNVTEPTNVPSFDKSFEQFSSDDDPEISFKTPSLVKSMKIVKPVEPVLDSAGPKSEVGVEPVQPLSESIGNQATAKADEPVSEDKRYQSTMVTEPVVTVSENIKNQSKAMVDVIGTFASKEPCDEENKNSDKKKRTRERGKSRWDPPEPIKTDELYDPTMPTEEEVTKSEVTTPVHAEESKDVTSTLPTEEMEVSKYEGTSASLTEMKKVGESEVTPATPAEMTSELYDPMEPTDDDIYQNQPSLSENQSTCSSENHQNDQEEMVEANHTKPSNSCEDSAVLQLEVQRSTSPEKHSHLIDKEEISVLNADAKTYIETVAKETNTKKTLSGDRNETEKLPNEEEICRSESKETGVMLEVALDHAESIETGMMIEVAPDHADADVSSKASLLTSKQLQMPTRESSPNTKETTEESSPNTKETTKESSPLKKETEEGEILSEADDKKEKSVGIEGEILSEADSTIEKSVGMAIETVVSDKKSPPDEDVMKVKVKVEPEESESQVIQSIVTSRGKPVVEHVISKVKVIGEEQSTHKMKAVDDTDEKLKKAQTEEALRLLEQFKGIDTKNEEAIKMIEKFRSVDKELKTLDLDKPRSKKESWEKESYKDRYEDSRYREHGKYKEKDRYSKDRDYDRYDDRSKSWRREKLWDKKRRGSQERYDSRDRHDKKRYKKDRYYDRRERSYSRDRSYSRSPDRGRRRSHDHSRSPSRDRSRERSRRRSRHSRSRSRDRGRKSKRSRQDRSRYSSSESDDSRSSASRSSRKEREPYLDSSKGEVDKLTEEWIRMATEKPKKSKTPTTTTATISSPVVSSVTSTATASPHVTTTPAYYQDAYGNYYPVTSTSQAYGSYPGMPPTQQAGQPQVMPSTGIIQPNQTMQQQQMMPPQGMQPQGMPQPNTMMPPSIQPSVPPGGVSSVHPHSGYAMPPPNQVMHPQNQGMAPQGQGMPSQNQGIAQQGQGMQPPNQMMAPQGQGMPHQSPMMPPQSQTLPPDNMQIQNQPVLPYQQTGMASYNQPYYGQPQQDQMYRTDTSMYGQPPQQVPPGQQLQPGQSSGGLLPTPMQGAPPQDPLVNQQSNLMPWQEMTPQLPGQSPAPLIGEKPEPAVAESSTKSSVTSNLQGTRLPFPMPTQQNVPVFKSSPAVAQQVKPIVSPQDASQSPVTGSLPDSRASSASPAIVTSSSKEYQLPELPYQQQGEVTLPLRSDITPVEQRGDANAESKPVDVKPMTKPLMALKGFKIKQKGLSVVMPTDNVVSSSYQSDNEEKSKKVEPVKPDVDSATPPVVPDLPKHPPPSSQTGLPIKLGMKQDKRDIDLASPPPSASPRPEKVKSRWRRLSDFETPVAQSPDSNVAEGALTASSASEGEMSPTKEMSKSKEVYDAWDPASDIVVTPEAMKTQPALKIVKKEVKRDKKEKIKESESPLKVDSPLKAEKVKEPEDPNKPPSFEPLDENLYLSERKKSKKMKRMLCDCIITEEEKKANVQACGEDCLNRMLYIECGSRCQCGEYCTNKRFQRREYSNVEPFRTEWKGFGLKTHSDLPQGQFVMEYVGEVLDYKTFKARTKQYAKSGESHFYFMALNADEVIDASYKGNISRFINHSCDPNCETQKWTVNGCLRVGFFTKKDIPAGTELTFDYQFETYGKEAQKCFCGTEKCRGTIGINKQTPLKSKKKTTEQEEEKKTTEELFQEEDLEEELAMLLEQGLHNKKDVLNICRLMVRSEEIQYRMKILKIVQDCSEGNCLRLFLDYHGLELLWTWTADNKEECQELKVKILETLKILPITTKNMIKESKILALVQRWAGREEGEELQPLQAVPPPPVPTEMPISILASSKESRQLKKRVRFPDEFSEFTSQELYTDFDSGQGSEADVNQSSDIDSTSDGSKEQPVRSPADSTEDLKSKVVVETVAADSSSALEEIKYIEPRPDPMDEVAALADELLVNWSDLKEVFRIPKKQQVEERKLLEKELDNSVKSQRIEQLERDQDRFRHLAAGWDTRKKKKRPPPPPPPDEEDLTDPNRPRKVLLPTPPKMSKEERRQIFEAQVKAQDEMAEIERQQREAYLQQFYSDPNNFNMYYGLDPNCPVPPGFPTQPGMEGGMEQQQYIDPNTGLPIPAEVIQAYIAQQQAVQPGYSEETLQQQMMSQQVQDQLLAQQAMSGYTQPTQEMMYQQPELSAAGSSAGESQAFIQQTATTPQKDTIAERVQQLQQQLEMQGKLARLGTSEEEDIPPPPSPPKSKPPKLPPNWKSAKDAEGKLYYYHTTTRQTQWSPPTWDEDVQDDMDIDTPPEDILKSSKKRTTTAAADTSTETAKKIKDQFRQKMSSYIVVCLNPYRKPDCKTGRIVSTDDFKHLARKLTHHVMSKELKHCRHVEDLEVNENVKAKAKDYVKKYMSKFGTMYRKSSSPDD